MHLSLFFLNAYEVVFPQGQIRLSLHWIISYFESSLTEICRWYFTWTSLACYSCRDNTNLFLASLFNVKEVQNPLLICFLKQRMKRGGNIFEKSVVVSLVSKEKSLNLPFLFRAQVRVTCSSLLPQSSIHSMQATHKWPFWIIRSRAAANHFHQYFAFGICVDSCVVAC